MPLSRSFSSWSLKILVERSPTVPFCLIWRTSFRNVISFYSLLTMASSIAFDSFLLTLWMMLRALSANFKVLTVSSTAWDDGLTVAIRNALVPPEKVSWSSLVNLESLYGTKSLFSDSCWMTFPNVVRLKLIFFISDKWPISNSSCLFSFSLPAKSHMFNLLLTIFPWSSFSYLIWKILWDLELCWFSKVDLVILLRSPKSIKFNASH